MSDNRRRGGQILVDQLRIHGVDLCFGVPGESYLAVLDALYDAPELRYVICRQEGGVAMAAEAYGKLTGRPGIAFVTRGPGATNASAGVHIAQQDSTPMILFIGQIDRGSVERDTFQEVNYRQMFGGIAKWVAEIDSADRIPEFVHRAFMTATAGRPGPVVLSLPEDMLMDRAAVEDGRPYRRVEAHPGAEDLARLRQMLERAERPMVILGGGGWSAEGVTAIRQLADTTDLPIACGFRRQDLLDNEHRCYVGDIAIGPNPKLVERIKTADLLIVVGSRLSEMTTQGFSLLEIPRPTQRFVHVHNDPEELGRIYEPDLPILCGHDRFRQGAGGDAGARAPAVGRGYGGDATVLPRLARAQGRARRRPDGRDRQASALDTFGGRHRHQRRRELLRLGQPLLQLSRVQDTARTLLRLHGLRHAGSGRSSTRPSRSARRVLRGRRLLHDDRPGDGDGRPIWPAAHRDRRQQRHVRDDPHASGARVPDARSGHRDRQPRLRGAGTGLWRLRRDRDAHGRLRGRPSPRRRRRRVPR